MQQTRSFLWRDVKPIYSKIYILYYITHVRLNVTSYSGLLKRGSSGVCELWSVVEPSQNKKRKTRLAKTEGGKRCVIARDDDLDTGKELPINALSELTTEQTNVTQTEQNTLKKSRHLIDTSARFLSIPCLQASCSGLVCLVVCYCHRMRTCLLAPRHTLLTPSHYSVHQTNPLVTDNRGVYIGKIPCSVGVHSLNRSRIWEK